MRCPGNMFRTTVIDPFAVCAAAPSCWSHTLAQFILLRRSSEYYPFKRCQVPVGHPLLPRLSFWVSFCKQILESQCGRLTFLLWNAFLCLTTLQKGDREGERKTASERKETGLLCPSSPDTLLIYLGNRNIPSSHYAGNRHSMWFSVHK